MGLVVNTNISSMNAQRSLDASGVQMSRAMQRLSSGSRINNGSDDAAGLAIATRLNAQVRGVNQAMRNANDGMAMLQTAEGGLGEVTNIITRIKELAVQSANGSNSSTDRTSIDAEVQALVSEVTRIAVQTKFGNTLLLDGSFNGVFQVGTDAGQTVSQSISNFKASALTGSVASQTVTLNADIDAVGAALTAFAGLTSSGLLLSGPKGIAFTRATAAGDDTSSSMENSQSAIAAAKVINEATTTTGISATVNAATKTVTGVFGNAINVDSSDANHTIKINGQTLTVNVTGTAATGRNQVVTAINSQITGVTAAAGAANGDIVLTAADGRNISVVAAGTANNTVGKEVFGFTTAVAAETVLARGTVTLQAGGNLTSTFTNGTQVSGAGAATAAATALSSLSVTSVANANTTMFVADAILDTISTARGNLGAAQNRLASTVANLGVVAEKVSDAKSRILDADFAAETSALTKAEILQQAGISILAQANARPQAVLALLRQ